MGNQCQQFLNTPEHEITTTNEDDYDPSIRDLKISLIKKICTKNDYLVLKPIANEEFNNQLKNKPVFYRIKNQLKEKLHQINFDESYYQNVTAFKITNVSTGDIQYYKGSYDINGQCCGKGLFMNIRGDYYFGDWENGIPNGFGIIVFNGMKSYEGEFKDGQKCGQGIEVFPDGDYYKGEFINGYREGKGKYNFVGGSYYNGDMKNSKFDGEGVFSWNNGQIYNGGFNNGKMNGHGTFKWNDGSTFSGYYSNNIKQGEGEYKWNNGSMLQGNWINNKPNGNSIFVTKGFKENISYQDGTIIGSVIPEL